MTLFKKYTNISLFKRIFTAMILGVGAGLIFKENILIIRPLGTVFINLLQMAALPLIIVNLIAGIASMNDSRVLGRVGIKIFAYYLLTTCLALIVGIFVAGIMKPGVGFELNSGFKTAIKQIPSFGETIIGLLPRNIFKALSEGRVDQIVIFSLFVAIGILFIPKNQKLFMANLFENFAELFRKLIWIVMEYAPVGVFALMATTVGKYGSQLVGFVAKYVISTYLCVIFMFIVYTILLILFSKLSPKKLFKAAGPVLVTTMSTSSSMATVPVTLAAADELKIPRSISGFTVPLGAQMNKDGNGIMLAISFMAVAQAVGVPLPLPVLLKVLLIGLILTTGAGGVPGGGIVTIAIIVDAFGLPLEMIGIIAGIFGLVDMGLTTANCFGDLVGTSIVGFSEKRKHPEALPLEVVDELAEN